MEAKELFQKIETFEKILIYGSESKAEECALCCKALQKTPEIAVTKADETRQIEGITVKSISEVTVDLKTLVLICTNERYHAEIARQEKLRDAGEILGLSMPELIELKRLCVLHLFQKSLGFEPRLFRGLNMGELLYGTSYDMDARMKDARKPSMLQKMWDLAGESSALYAIRHMRNARVFGDVDEYHRYVKNLIQDFPDDSIHFEFGVAGGNMLNFFSEGLKQTFYGFDSFAGLPESWMDGIGEKAFSQAKLPRVNDNVRLIHGYFEESLPKYLAEHQSELSKIGFLHIDCDLYSSTKTIFENLGKYLKPGTIISFDEYINYPGWEMDEHQAFQEWVKDCRISYRYLAYAENNTQVTVEIL